MPRIKVNYVMLREAGSHFELIPIGADRNPVIIDGREVVMYRSQDYEATRRRRRYEVARLSQNGGFLA